MTPSTSTAQKKTDGQQEGEHGGVQHVQIEHYQKNVLRVIVIVSGPVGNPESSLIVHRPNYKFLGLSLSTRVWFNFFFL